jgi:hypothetical protein
VSISAAGRGASAGEIDKLALRSEIRGLAADIDTLEATGSTRDPAGAASAEIDKLAGARHARRGVRRGVRRGRPEIDTLPGGRHADAPLGGPSWAADEDDPFASSSSSSGYSSSAAEELDGDPLTESSCDDRSEGERAEIDKLAARAEALEALEAKAPEEGGFDPDWGPAEREALHDRTTELLLAEQRALRAVAREKRREDRLAARTAARAEARASKAARRAAKSKRKAARRARNARRREAHTAAARARRAKHEAEREERVFRAQMTRVVARAQRSVDRLRRLEGERGALRPWRPVRGPRRPVRGSPAGAARAGKRRASRGGHRAEWASSVALEGVGAPFVPLYGSGMRRIAVREGSAGGKRSRSPVRARTAPREGRPSRGRRSTNGKRRAASVRDRFALSERRRRARELIFGVAGADNMSLGSTGVPRPRSSHEAGRRRGKGKLPRRLPLTPYGAADRGKRSAMLRWDADADVPASAALRRSSEAFHRNRAVARRLRALLFRLLVRREFERLRIGIALRGLRASRQRFVQEGGGV